MDDDDFMEVNLTGLDLNQEPAEQLLPRVTRYGSLSNELVSAANARVEERIRQLEAVTARDRHRQRWRQSRNSTDTSYSVSETSAEVDSRSFIPSNGPTALPGSSTLERAKGCKRDSSHLVAQALAMDAEVQKADNEEGSFYNCSICLDMAREPVLTCCGHLFCWPCFYQVPGVDSDSKQCPVCKGEVSNNTVIPIYGNGGCETICVSESGMPIPPRPKARRVESARQQRVTQGLSHVLVAEALRRIRTSIGAMGSPIWEEGGEGDPLMRIHQASRVLSESAASLSSLSAALNNAERLVDDLESVVNNRVLRNVTRNIAVRTLLADERRVNAGQPVAQVPPSSSSPAAVVRRRNFMVYRDDRETRRRRLN